MGDVGVMVKGWRYLFSRGEVKSAGLDFIPASTWGIDRAVMKPTDYLAHIKAHKGLISACVRINGNAMASVPTKLYVAQKKKGIKYRHTPTKAIEKSKRHWLEQQEHLQPYMNKAIEVEEVLEHPVLTLLQNVNGYRNAFDLKFLTNMFQDLTGNGYWYLPKNGFGQPAQIWFINPAYMKIIPDKEKFIKGYVYRRGSIKIEYEPDEIIHFLYPGPDPYYGQGPVAGAADAVNLRDYMTDYEKSIFRNMGRPDGVLKSKKTLDKAQSARIEAKWDEKYGGVTPKRRIAVMDDWLEYQELGSKSPRDMQYQTGWKMTREDIVVQFGVPLSYFTMEASSLAAAKTHLVYHARITVKPNLQRYDQKLNEQLIPKYDGEGLFLASDDPVPEDSELALKQREINISTGVTTIDEERAKDGLEPLGINRPLQPMSMVPVGSGEEEERHVEEAARRFARIVKEELQNAAGNTANRAR